MISPDVAAPPRPIRSERAVVLTVALVTMLAPLNSTMIAVALPRILEVFGVSLGLGGWLVTAYLLVMAALQPVAGKLGDRLGRRRLVLGGLVYFGLASLGAALAPTFAALLAFRVQQALAGALIVPNGMALIREVVPTERRGGRSGLVGSAVAFAAAIGPPLGGILVSLADWRAIFLVNLLLVVPALVLGFQTVPSTAVGRARSGGFDLGGAVALSALLVGLAALLNQERSLSDAAIAVGAAALALGLLAFLRHEAAHPDPVLQPRFFRVPTFAAANATVGLSNLAMYSTLVVVPLFLAGRLGWTSASVGMILAILSAAMVLFSPLGGRLADRWGRRWPTALGLLVLSIGLLPLAVAGPSIESGALAISLALAGVGLGLATSGMQTAALEAVSGRHAGSMAGVYATSRYLGSIVGTSVLSSMAAGSHFGPVLTMVVVAAVLSSLASLGIADRPADHAPPHSRVSSWRKDGAMTRFRPCIDLHEGKVKQIVGGSLTDSGMGLRTNFVASQPPEHFAALYRADGLVGGHVVKLGPGNDDAARAVLAAWPGGLQLGGGVTLDNARAWLEAGADKVVVTSWLFPDAVFATERLDTLARAIGRERLVVDLSCRRVGDGWRVAIDRWQRQTDFALGPETLAAVAEHCAEFLIHAADVEGLARGIDAELVAALGRWSPIPCTYAGGANALADLDLVQRLSEGRVDLTFGSALDIFGGSAVRYQDCVAWNQAHA